MSKNYTPEYRTTKTVDMSWNTYHKTVAKHHLSNYGVIILDADNIPIDDESQLDAISQYPIKIT